MSELKFACPVCGQHITADSAGSGSKLECPTCFQIIVVPQPPSGPDTKLFLSAAKADKPRPPGSTAGAGLGPLEKPVSSGSLTWVLAGVFLLVLAGAGYWVWHHHQLHPAPVTVVVNTNPPPRPKPPPRPPFVLRSAYTVPTNVAWTLDPAALVIPAGAVIGSIHSNGFQAERAILQGALLTLRQGTGGMADLSVTIPLFTANPEELTSKIIAVNPDQGPPIPKVTIRWRTDYQKSANKSFTNGYLLKLVFGGPGRGKMPGKIYLSVPDSDKSFIAGTFEAEIRKPPPPKPAPPPKPKPGEVQPPAGQSPARP